MSWHRKKNIFSIFLMACSLFQTTRAGFLDRKNLSLKDCVGDNEHNMIFLCSRSADKKDDNIAIMKLGCNGKILWEKEYCNLLGLGNVVSSIRLDGQGNIVVFGYKDSAKKPLVDINNQKGYFLAKLNQNGECAWKTSMRPSQGKLVRTSSMCMTLDKQDNAFIIARCDNDIDKKSSGNDDYLLFKYDKNGNRVFDRTLFAVPRLNSLNTPILGFDAQSKIYILEEREEGYRLERSYQQEYFINCYNSEALLQWRKFISKTEKSQWGRVDMNSEGIFYLQYNPMQIKEFQISKYNLKGEVVWKQQYKTIDDASKDNKSYSTNISDLSFYEVAGNLYVSIIKSCYKIDPQYSEQSQAEDADSIPDPGAIYCGAGVPDSMHFVTMKLNNEGKVLQKSDTKIPESAFIIKYNHYVDLDGNIYSQCFAREGLDPNNEYFIIVKYEPVTGHSTVTIIKTLDEYLSFLSSRILMEQ